MHTYNKLFQTIKSAILGITLFLFPLFFLTTTQEFFVTNKLYFLIFSALLLLLVSAIEMLVEKRLTIKRDFLDLFKISFLIATICSLFVSPNKIQALLNQNFGVVAIASLTIISFYLKRSKIVVMKILPISGLILSLITIVYFFQPFQKVQLPYYLLFLKNPLFTPLGGQLDLAIFLGFIVVTQLLQIIFIDKVLHEVKSAPWAHFVLLGISIIALILSVYSLMRGALPQMPPFSYSWYASVETLKNPVSALFGIGIDNFASIFTRIKDVTYNQASFWQVNSFNISHSTVLHIMTEAGIVGLLTFFLLVLAVVNKGWKDNKLFLVPILYVGFILLILPPSLIVFFLFFVALTVLDENIHERKNIIDADLERSPAYIAFPIFVFIFVAFSLFFVGRSYLAEYYFKGAVDGLAKNNARQLYDNQRLSIIMNPFIERFRINFAQTNLLLANNLATKARQQAGSSKLSPTKELTNEERQIISQSIQAAIEEAKAAVALNEQKASNWENLAVIYRNLINTAQGADSWAISSYQRAIILDPNNPQYRMNLGGVYYSISHYEEAAGFFGQAVALKSDWPNAHYNLAWTYFQKKDYQKAVDEMQSVVSLLNPTRDPADFKKAQKDLDNFKSFLPKTNDTNQISPQTETQPRQLILPSPPVATVEPKLQLPKNASPEAGAP